MPACMRTRKMGNFGLFFQEFPNLQSLRDGLVRAFNFHLSKHPTGKAHVRAAENVGGRISASPGFSIKMPRVGGRQQRAGQPLQGAAGRAKMCAGPLGNVTRPALQSRHSVNHFHKKNHLRKQVRGAFRADRPQRANYSEHRLRRPSAVPQASWRAFLLNSAGPFDA